MTKFNLSSIVSVFTVILLFSCATDSKMDKNLKNNSSETEKLVQEAQIDINEFSSPESEKPEVRSISLTFTGDIMAHTNVTRMKNFDLIYEDILDITKNDDLTFANFETPVVDSQEYENWPTFNARNDYALTAMKSGFEVFTLANNHTNDQGLKGIQATRDFFDSQKKNGIYSCGLKYEENGDFTYQLIEKNGFKVLFMGVTEIYNSSRFIEWFDTTDRSEKSRNAFIARVTKMREEHPCDIFVLAFHCNEPEYVIPVTDKRKAYYHRLLEAGVDVIWANHPHVMQEWEVIKSAKDPFSQKVIMYSVGNLISGQRYKRNYEQPDAAREYTGECILMQLNFTKVDDKILCQEPEVTILTNHTIGPAGAYDTVIKKLNDDFIESLAEPDKSYYRKRLELCNEITGKTLWN